ncbi:sensor histidine kinase [Paractinoplanes globisporus]|uniref:Sensor-like histidine kinase SenX3 n=1 Tax=Paractinoplanes globisporus TaxID=113565 RepID=A0ABW6WRR1_9ACTN|nr:PAS domain-containing sensor histidine kinase [Actinoplanes globisporus]
MQIAAHDLGRLSRLTAGCAGVAVAVIGALAAVRVPPASRPAAALFPAGLALLLQTLPASKGTRTAALAFALIAAGAGALSLASHPAAAAATVLAGLGLAGLDLRVARSRFRVADPLVAGAAIIALVALVPRMFDPTFPPGRGPGGVMSPAAAGGLLALALGTILARPETGPLRTAETTAGPGTTVRRTLPALIAVPAVAALVSALAARTGIGRPAAAISTGAILAALALLGLVGYLVRTLDTADRRQRRLVGELNDRQEFAATLLQSMSEAVMVLDANHRVIDVNRRWRELTGHGPDEPIRLDPPPLPPAGGGDYLMPRVDGTMVPVLATVATIPDAEGAPRAYVATYVDIADRKRAEESLGEQNAELREANARLEAALAFKNDLTSMLTHDVAQPLSSIASLAELLRADWADLPDDIRLELTTKIDQNTQRLIKMMNDLQLLFRLDTGSVTARRAPVPLLEVAASSAATGFDGVEIDVAEELAVLADRGHLTVVLQNLLKNALTYGDPPVRLAARRRGDLVEIVVQDSGPGVPEELVPSLFGRFVRGAGLGLFIVRHLMEANGGSVRYERAEPRGARLIVTLEAAPI